MNFTPFREVLEKRCGLVFPNEKTAILEAGIRSRMEARGISSPVDYLSALTADQQEFGRLIDHLTINETYLLREPIHFELLSGRIVPELLHRNPPGRKLKILSAGCSTGEEAYSVVISLAERFGSESLGSIAVFGVDIDSTVIAEARQGSFGKHSFRDFPERLLHKYFEAAAAGRYRIRDRLRESVAFLPLNLLSADYPSVLREIDVIFYRNVSIYFSQDVRNEVFARLATSLVEGGYLIVSPSETFFYNKGLLSLVPLDGAFVYRKDPAAAEVDLSGKPPAGRVSVRRRAAAAGTPHHPGRLAGSGENRLEGRSAAGRGAASGPAAPAASPSPRTETSPSLEAALELARSKEYAAALEILDRLLVHTAGSAAHTLKGGILLNLSRLDEARTSCLAALDADRFCLEATFCLGVIARLRGDEPNALRRFREAVYIQPSCWPAHFYLGETYLQQGEAALARREYEVILKLLEKGEFSAHGIAILPLSFSAAQLETLCRSKLLQVKGASNGA